MVVGIRGPLCRASWRYFPAGVYELFLLCRYTPCGYKGVSRIANWAAADRKKSQALQASMVEYSAANETIWRPTRAVVSPTGLPAVDNAVWRALQLIFGALGVVCYGWVQVRSALPDMTAREAFAFSMQKAP